MTGAPEPISDTARQDLERELGDLRAQRDAVARTLGSDDAVGDLADEADELQRATETARLDSRIAAIEERLKGASIAGPPPTDAIGVGSTVTVRFADDTVATVHLGEIADELDETLVTADSPLGQALLGRHSGDTVSYRSPEGRVTAAVLRIVEGNDAS
ncbi:GreA/GreB family elongation factor [Streptomyces sp. NPDC051940]|uniref:GreA/GreB family elongation factor n=1 Tax=Streptomyces sp. NPDC051940 TaxID=3155675 RepID=UPI0034263861